MKKISVLFVSSASLTFFFLLAIAEASASCPPGRACPPPVTRGRPTTPSYPSQYPPTPSRSPTRYPVPPVTRGSDSGRLPTAGQCPPYTTYERRLGRCVADPYGRRRIEQRIPSRTGNSHDESLERSATNIVNAALRGLDCGQAADSLRRLSNQILSLQVSGPGRDPGGRPGDPGEEVRRKWREQVQSPKFWKRVWNHMASAYQSCNRSCFDDGIAVGQISATAYCSASVALEGLPGPGYIEQPPLPVCETSIFTGCLKAYGDTAAETAGCSAYTSGSFEGIFAEYQSQDCHL